MDDDTKPRPDLLYAYARAAQVALHGDGAGTGGGDGSPSVFGFAGVTLFVEEEPSMWGVGSKAVGMIDNFTLSMRVQHPPWSPSANLMLRRTVAAPTDPAFGDAGCEGSGGGGDSDGGGIGGGERGEGFDDTVSLLVREDAPDAPQTSTGPPSSSATPHRVRAPW